MRSKRVHKSLRKKFSKKYNRSLRLKKRGGAKEKKIYWLDTNGAMHYSEIKTDYDTDKEARHQFFKILDNKRITGALLLGITHVSGIKGFFFSRDIELKSLYKHLSSINLNGVKTINNECFRHCSSLTEIILPDVKEILHGGFEDCISLKTAYIPKVKEIQSRAFLGCRSLREIEAKRVITIGESAFDNCYYLKVIILPNIKILGGYAFSGACAAHESIELKIPDNFEEELPKVLITKARRGEAYLEKQRKEENEEAEARGRQQYLEEQKRKEEIEKAEQERALQHEENLREALQKGREAHKRGDPDPDEVGDGPAMEWLNKQNNKRSKKSNKLTFEEVIGSEKAFELGSTTFGNTINELAKSEIANQTLGRLGEAALRLF